jgi:hypothetical protein
MTDTITLPRAVGLHIRNLLRGIVTASKALAALDAALAEPEKVTVQMQYGWLCDDRRNMP